MMARPTKLKPEVRAGLIEAVELGATWEAAAQSVGIGASTLRQWRQRGEAGEAPFAALLADLKRADADCISRALQVIRQAAEGGQWQAAAWLLERRHPADYGRRVESRVEVSAPSPQDGVRTVLERLAGEGESSDGK